MSFILSHPYSNNFIFTVGQTVSLPLPTSTPSQTRTLSVVSRARGQQHAYRIKTVLEALAARDVRKVLLQPHKALALEQFFVHTWAGPLRKLADIIAELQLPVAEERREGSVRDREVVPDGKLDGGWEQLLDLGDRRDEGIWRLATVEERYEGREDLGRYRVDEEPHARTLDGVFQEQARVQVQVCDELEQDERLSDFGQLWRRVLRVRPGAPIH